MIEIKVKLAPGSMPEVTVEETLRLPFQLRQKSRLRTQSQKGEEVWLLLPRGEILRGGDRLLATDGRLVEVIAEEEDLMQVTCQNATALARAAYHLGNRHIPLQVGEGFLQLSADHVLETLLLGLGAMVKHRRAPFEPEAGAYGGGHHHHGEEEEEGAASGLKSRAKIHEYVNVKPVAPTMTPYKHG